MIRVDKGSATIITVGGYAFYYTSETHTVTEPTAGAVRITRLGDGVHEIFTAPLSDFVDATGSVITTVFADLELYLNKVFLVGTPREVTSATVGDDLIIKDGEHIKVGVLSAPLTLTIEPDCVSFNIDDNNAGLEANNITVTLNATDSVTLAITGDRLDLYSFNGGVNWSFYNARSGDRFDIPHG